MRLPATLCCVTLLLVLFVLLFCFLNTLILTPYSSTAADPSRKCYFPVANAHPELGLSIDGLPSANGFGSEERLLFEPDLVVKHVQESLKFKTVSHVLQGHETAEENCWEMAEFRGILDMWKREYSHLFAVAEQIDLPVDIARTATSSLNTLVLRWKGSDPSLKPALFLNHYDVVPVEDGTEKHWLHPPFSGFEDVDGYLWGRGTIDDKVNSVTVLEAMDALAKSDWKPARTVYIALGHDEEVGGAGGAAVLAEYFASQGVKLELVIDEGGAVTVGIMKGVERPVAVIGITEKGYVSLDLKVDDISLSGHSSMPPEETIIGVLSRAVVRTEETRFPLGLPEPTQQTFKALSADLPATQRFLVTNMWLFKPFLEYALDHGTPLDRAMVRTSISPTMFHSGNKDNVLPRSGSATVNFRIKFGETVAEVIAIVNASIGDPRVKIVKKENMCKDASPISTTNSLGYRILSSVIGDMCPECARIPYVVGGGTDARHFQQFGISDSVYRFSPIRMESSDMPRFHGTNERVHRNDIITAVAFWIRLAERLCGQVDESQTFMRHGWQAHSDL